MLLDEKTQLFRERLNKIYKVNTYKKLSPSELYDYVNFIENNKNAMHLGFFHIQIYCNERAKYLILNAKLKFYTNTESNTKINMVEKNKIISKLKYAIASSNSYIKNLRPSLYGKYHAKVVLFLENCKKNEPANFSNPNAVISLRDVSKYYVNKFNAFKVLKNVDLEINNGEFVVILGPSGSGKTTLLNIISGMDNATYGEVIVAGESLINKRDSALTSFRKRNVGYVFQQYGLLPNLNVRENVEIGANLQKNDSKKIDIDELLKVLGIFDFRKKLPYELSGGQQQRVSIARSLAKNPNVLFGDEPTGAIDEKNTKEILTLFKKTNKKYKTTIIIVTHNNLIAEMADTVIKFNDGKVSQILHNPNPKTVEEIN
jgi:putative ABC transport system ATP-binding protein